MVICIFKPQRDSLSETESEKFGGENQRNLPIAFSLAKVSAYELTRKAERLAPGIDPLNLHSPGAIH